MIVGTGENRFVYANPEKCIGCKNCEIACGISHENTDIFTAVQQGCRVQSRTTVVQAGDLVMPIQCRQCENAPCAVVCPTGALYHADGMVKLSEAACIGCKVCTMVCPFGAIRMTVETKTVSNRVVKKARALKCDLCIDKTGEIAEASCACIQACPTKAMFLVDTDAHRKKILEERGKEAAQVRSNKG
ncbi:Iron-sulfur protein [Sporomusa carbonis]|uniref:4Fe-4S dicluster domain-containing protein n=1 Tax=Sporomusa carbonis TaxID=3076075 RepID=UPI003A643E60